MICTFVIYMIGIVAHVRIKRVERIRITPDWLERVAAEDIAALRFIVSSPEISRELWIYTPKGTFRFFRVLAGSLVELDRYGQLMPDQPPVPKRRKAPVAPVGKPGDPEPAPDSAGTVVDASFVLLPPGTTGPVDSRESPISDRPSGLVEEKSPQESLTSDRPSKVEGRLRLPSSHRGSAYPSDGGNNPPDHRSGGSK